MGPEKALRRGGWAALNNKKKLFTSKDISLQLQLRLVRCYIFSVLLYGLEAWTTTDATLKRLESFEMWTYRHILKISCREVMQRGSGLYSKKTEAGVFWRHTKT